MKESLLDIVVCPLDKHDLDLEDAEREDDEIVDGTLVCVDCGERYPIEDGIPNLLPPDMRDGDAAEA